MPVAVTYKPIKGELFEYPFRIIISGSSQCGKTTLAERILKENLFQREPQLILYCHPDLQEGTPVKWDDKLDIPITYHTGLPTLKKLSELPKHTVVVLDDLYEECITSKAIDQLFRVISGKKDISVIAMTQRFFAQGRFGMNIRNNCNHIVIMRNADERINKRLSNLFNCKDDLPIALKEFENEEFPYIMINSTRASLVSGCRIYTKLFGKVKYCVMNGEKLALLPKEDFRKHFKVIAKNQAKARKKTAKWYDGLSDLSDCYEEPSRKRRKLHHDEGTSNEESSLSDLSEDESMTDYDDNKSDPDETHLHSNTKKQIESNRKLLNELSERQDESSERSQSSDESSDESSQSSDESSQESKANDYDDQINSFMSEQENHEKDIKELEDRLTELSEKVKSVSAGLHRLDKFDLL